jgi:diguanylate cyclase (GGDEF)-like protein
MSLWCFLSGLFRKETDPSPAPLQRGLEALDCHFALFDPQRRLVFNNSSYAKLHSHAWDKLPLPRTYDNLMRASIINGAPCEDVDAELALRIAAHERNGIQHFERLYPGNRWMRVSRVRLPDGYVAGLSLDINDLKAREAATAASEARYRGLVDTASVGIWHLDDDGTTIFGNERLAQLFGGTVPALFSEGGVRGTAVADENPFGFPVGVETRTMILRGLQREPVPVLLAAAAWVVQPQGSGAHFSQPGEARRTVVLTLVDVSALEAARAQVDHLAWHDVLTDLPNRAAFGRAMKELRHARMDHAALLLIDLDMFKAVNDRHGHAAGDALLCEVARRMRSTLRPGDFLSRLGGDEFAVLLLGAAAAANSSETADRLSRLLAEPVSYNGTKLPLSASIGIALYPDHGADEETLQRAADLALYRVKHQGRGGITVYTPVLSEAYEQARLLRDAFGDALAMNRLELHWQKQVHAGDGSLRGLEALIRWPNSPTGGTVSPAVFLPVIADAGFMPQLDSWVLETALRQSNAWSHQTGNMPICGINISAVSLKDPTFPMRVADALLRHNVAASSLEIEVPEDIAVADLNLVEPVLNALRAIGVRLALDDFGGGLSSIAHLVRLPVDSVKLDRSVVAGLPDGVRERAVLKAVMGIVRSMHIPLIAEGVENEDQAAALLLEGCTIMQGFLYGRPTQAAAIYQHDSLSGIHDPVSQSDERDALRADEKLVPDIAAMIDGAF